MEVYQEPCTDHYAGVLHDHHAVNKKLVDYVFTTHTYFIGTMVDKSILYYIHCSCYNKRQSQLKSDRALKLSL